MGSEQFILTDSWLMTHPRNYCHEMLCALLYSPPAERILLHRLPLSFQEMFPTVFAL
jgi:hypothetical protein